MKINCKQTIAKLFSSFNMLVVFLAGVMILLSSSTSFAPTKMSDAELSDVEAQALISIQQFSGSSAIPFGTISYQTGSEDTIRLMLGLNMELAGHIRSFKAGYYYGNAGNVGWETGWDVDMTNWFFGTSDRVTPLTWTGVYIDFGFDNYTSNTTRRLNYVELGTLTASGQITESINTINGLVTGGTGQNQGVLLRQTASGRRIVNFNNAVMAFVFATKYNYSSYAGGSTSGLSGIFVKIPSYDTNDISNP
jgi:hypothetical protein